MFLILPTVVDDDIFVSSTIPETDHAEWSAGTTYAAGDKVIVSADHRVYECLQPQNIGQAPSSSTYWWADAGPTNRWAMFDTASTVSSQAASAFTVVLDLPAINNLALVGVAGASVSLSGAGVSITRAIPAPTAPETVVTLLINDIQFEGGELTIAITAPATVALQNLVVGSAFALGDAQHGATIGITDYSVKTVDDFGVASVTRRGYSRRINARVAVPIQYVDSVLAMLAGVRATFCVWQVAARHDALTLFGYYTDWQLEVTYSTMAMYSITLESKVIVDQLPAVAVAASSFDFLISQVFS